MPVTTRVYSVVALSVPIVFNNEGDHDPNGMLYALRKHVDKLKEVRNAFRSVPVGQDCPYDEAAPRVTGEFAGERHAHAYPAHPRKPHPLVRPLVLRANVGDRVHIHFENQLDRRAGMHLIGDGYDVNVADGAHVGNNPDTTVPSGGSRTYDWMAMHEGVFPFHDMGSLSGGEDGTNLHGLFGALVVEPADSIWTDPVTGERLDDPDDGEAGLYVDVHPPAPPPGATPSTAPPCGTPDGPNAPRRSFREHVVFFHDEPEVGFCLRSPEGGHAGAEHGAGDPPMHDRRGRGPRDGEDVGDLCGPGRHMGANLDQEPMLTPISYRSEPMMTRNKRLMRMKETFLDEKVEGEEQHHSSWLFGDPATPILRAYRCDPVRIRLVHAGVKETHVFHLHVHQWRPIPDRFFAGPNPTSILDSVSISPQTAMTIEPMYGAGSLQGAIGDVIWHCHLYSHFHEGMWAILRVRDKMEDGSASRTYPDGSPVPALRPLPDRLPPPAPTVAQPGFPQFMPSKITPAMPRQKSPPPPDNPRRLDPAVGLPPATPLELGNFVDNRQPGEAFVKIDPNMGPTGPRRPADRVFHISAIAMNVVYNKNGFWHDPDGHLFVLDEDVDDVRSGLKPPQPLFIRANAGEVLELHFTNKLPHAIPATAFSCLTHEVECGLHVHLVKFDVLVADGGSVGWNYLSGVRPGESMVFRWYVNPEVQTEHGTVFFHDHLMANFRQKRGLFAALIVEPEGSRWFDPRTPLPAVPANLDGIPQLRSGAEAVVVPGQGRAYREFCIAVADQVPMFDRRDEPLNPPPAPDSNEDQGVMAINYRCEPLRLRPGDPADWFSSTVHGDPETPIFRTYPGDPIRLRLVQGSHEEQHSFMVHGLRWRNWRNDTQSPTRNRQTIGISEAFTFEIAGPGQSPAGDEWPYGRGDYMYLLGANDDLWLGCWGLVRALDAINSGELPTLPDRPNPDFTNAHLPVIGGENTRHFDVLARPREVLYHGRLLTDPFGLVYELFDSSAHPGHRHHYAATPFEGEPLVLRCQAGEWVEVELYNGLPPDPQPEPNPPRVPVDVDVREVSPRVSLHANALLYDVRENDGTYAGRNPDQTVPHGSHRTYRWYADTPGVYLLQDMADFRNHRHHGLVGALVVEEAGATARNPTSGAEAWAGARAVVSPGNGGPAFQELVLLLQDGLRLFMFGNLGMPLGDESDEPEDQGNKAFNYRAEPLDFSRGPDALALDPATPLWQVAATDRLRLHLVVVGDKPRNHSFTIHGHAWPLEPHVASSLPVPMVSWVGALSTGSAHTLDLGPEPGHHPEPHPHPRRVGDYAYRSGAYRWTLGQGAWGIIRSCDGRTGISGAGLERQRAGHGAGGTGRRPSAGAAILPWAVIGLGLYRLWRRVRR